VVSTGSAQSAEMTKRDYFELPAKAVKHFQCAYLLNESARVQEAKMAAWMLSEQFSLKGYELGKQYLEAMDSGTISMRDAFSVIPSDDEFLSLIPSEFQLALTGIHFPDPQQKIAFDLGRVSFYAAGGLQTKLIIIDKNGHYDASQMGRKSTEVLSDYCDYDALDMPAKELENLRSQLK
jgi:hypothetical protein